MVEKAVARHVDDAPLQRVLRRKGDGVHDEIELAPVLGDALEHRLHLAGRVHVERHDDRRFELARERLDVFLRLVVEIGHGDLGAERPERLGAAPGDRIFVGDADDEALLAFEELGFDGGDHGRLPLAVGFERLPLQVALGDFLELAKGLASVLGIVDVRDLPAVDLQMALAPGSDIDLELVVPHRRDELLHRRASPRRPGLDRLPIRLVCSHFTGSRLPQSGHNAISGT